ncbi:hypothetical protein ACFLTB_06155 [Chloroflexota bacterium]
MSGPLWLMKLVLVLTTEAVARMVTEGAEATPEAEEDKEDTRITFDLSLLKKHKTLIVTFIRDISN